MQASALSERTGTRPCVLAGIPAVWHADVFHSLDWGCYHIHVTEL